MKSLLLFIIAGTLPFAASAQRQICEDSLCKPREVVVKTSLIGPMQVASYVTLGVEVPVYRQFAIQAEGIYLYKFIHNASKLAANKANLGIQADLKYYVPKSTTLRIYTGPSVTWRKMYTDEGRIEWYDGVDPDGIPGRFPKLVMDSAALVKTTNTDIIWQIGIQPLIAKHFALNLYTGIGLGLLKQTVQSGPVPSGVKSGTQTYFSKIIGLQAGFAF